MNNFDILETLFRNNSSEEFRIRQINKDDYNKGYMELLSQLTVCGECDYSEWEKRFEIISKNDLIEILVVECLDTKKIVGSITLLIEPKFIRNLGKVCHIEDVVVDKDYRKNKLGTKLLNMCMEYSKAIGCYKVILDCAENVSKFYENNGFEKKSVGMALYLN